MQPQDTGIIHYGLCGLTSWEEGDKKKKERELKREQQQEGKKSHYKKKKKTPNLWLISIA